MSRNTSATMPPTGPANPRRSSVSARPTKPPVEIRPSRYGRSAPRRLAKPGSASNNNPHPAAASRGLATGDWRSSRHPSTAAATGSTNAVRPKKLNSAADRVAPSQPARLFGASRNVEAWKGLGSRGEWDRRATATSNAPRRRATAAASRTTRSRITGLPKPTPPPESRAGHSTRRSGGRCCSIPF